MIICGTGHRPQFCPCGFENIHPWLESLKNNLKACLNELEPHAVICGGAIGFDTWLAECALDLNLPLHLYIPFRDQGAKWPKSSQVKYKQIMSRATNVYFVHEEYCKSCFFDRDKAMVDNADMVFSLLNPKAQSGGTFYTVKYAESKNKPIKNFWVD